MPTSSSAAPAAHHHFRTFLAAIFGILAMFLILASILVIWLNRTLLDTTTYVNTVAPVATQLDVQNFLADKAAQQVIASAPTNDIATQLLTADQINGKSSEQLQAELHPIIQQSVLEVVGSPSFAELWKTTNQNAHTQLINSLKGNSDEVSLDLTPAVHGLVDQLKQTKLSPISDKLTKADLPTVKLDLKGSTLDHVYYFYGLFKQLSSLVISVTFLLILLCIGISVHHIRTLRRIIFGTGILSLVLTILFYAPRIIAPRLDALDQKAALAVASVLLHNLQVATLILAIACLAVSIGSKFHPRLKSGVTR